MIFSIKNWLISASFKLWILVSFFNSSIKNLAKLYSTLKSIKNYLEIKKGARGFNN
ncbi:hypothetical protein [Mycoplasma sp. SG1]|uniref:hypothetical protein n=1 Tax=Mycoplasma sp. SG1 TaxID=2810348 RepID=UPI002025A5F3|nr:hypothetical protein [Mycoplasma sp. SG1]URM53204.1 hypothetical protein JRW51_02555 [Mycoplasma sp. SG1]